MKAKSVLMCISVILLSVMTSCASFDSYYKGNQPKQYIENFKNVEVMATEADDTPNFSTLEEAQNYTTQLKKATKALVEEVEYYRNQFTEEPDVIYVPVDSSSGLSAEKASSTELIEENKQESRTTVTGNHQFFNAITNYTYVEGRIYDVFFTPANITDIKLEANESVVNIVIGNPNAWLCETVVAPENNKNYTHVFLRPYNTNHQSDCMILTDRRTYYLRLISTVSTAQIGVRWNYPYSSGKTSSIQVVSPVNNESGASYSSQEQNAFSFSKDVSDLNFNYIIEGVASWKPVKAYSDRERTYIQFDNSFLSNSETPVVYLKHGSEESLVNFTVKGITYIIPLILSSEERFILKAGDSKITVGLDI